MWRCAECEWLKVLGESALSECFELVLSVNVLSESAPMMRDSRRTVRSGMNPIQGYGTFPLVSLPG